MRMRTTSELCARLGLWRQRERAPTFHNAHADASTVQHAMGHSTYHLGESMLSWVMHAQCAGSRCGLVSHGLMSLWAVMGHLAAGAASLAWRRAHSRSHRRWPPP